VADVQRSSFVTGAIWDSMERLQAWFNSPDYRAARKIGDKYAKFRTFAIQGAQ
jgi:heme-degrading monooxygenase HmoA